MFSFTKPSRTEIETFIDRQANEEFSYPDVGASLTKPPEDYIVDHNMVVIGHGDQVWQQAKDAIRSWKMFDLSWVELCWPETAIEKDRNVAILISHLGFYSLNAARIVYTIDEPESFGFAYGTLPEHGESGEERFLVKLNRDTGEVCYDLYAFSVPNHVMSWLGYRIARMLQKQFAVDSKAAMLRTAARNKV